jgi:hypothetical protein
LLVIGTILLSSCANATPSLSGEASSDNGSRGLMPIDFANPLGTVVSSISVADSFLPFLAIEPRNLGQYEAISATDPATTPMRDRSVAFVYAGSTYGQYFVQESKPTLTQDELNDLADCQPGETACSTVGWSLVSIRKGVTALLIYAPAEVSEATSLTWLEGDIMFVVMGPRNTLSDSDALSIAEGV